jgi:hypothetical protein
MKHLLSTLFVALWFAATAVAQGQQPSGAGQQPSTGQAAKMTISGCIQMAPPEAKGADAAPAPQATSKFDLASAKVVSGGPVGTSGAGTTATRYRLEGDEKAISPHLNRQVEITGTVSPAASIGATAAPMLKVESVKMVAAKCQ